MAGKLLRGWAAIAEHLGLPERTLMEYARRDDNADMPILKFGERKSAQVAAYDDQLDAWLTVEAAAATGALALPGRYDMIEAMFSEYVADFCGRRTT